MVAYSPQDCIQSHFCEFMSPNPPKETRGVAIKRKATGILNIVIVFLPSDFCLLKKLEMPEKTGLWHGKVITEYM